MNQSTFNLQQQIQDALTNVNELRDSSIEVLDSNGIITLRGTVPDTDARERAEAIVRDLEGVTAVVNELDVR